MRSVRVIPCLDVTAGRVVKGVQFVDLVDAGDPVELAARYDAEGADELVFLDITASADGRDTMVDVVSRTAEEVFIPLTVGGGVRSVEDARRLLRAGADKVALNTAAVDRPALVAELAAEFGAQCVVVAVDARARPGAPDVDAWARPGARDVDARARPGARDVDAWARPGARDVDARARPGAPDGSAPRASDPVPGWEVFTHGGRTPTPLDAVEWAEECAAAGAGEILLTSMDRDGTRDGFDLSLTRAVSDRCRVPVVASGGVGELDHLVAGAVEGAADAVLAASIFHRREFTVGQAKAHLAAAGVPVRPA